MDERDKKERPIPRKQALKILGPIFDTLRDIHFIAKQRHNENIKEEFRLRKGTKASIFHDLIIDKADRVFRGREGYRFIEDNNGFYLVKDNILYLRFKKLNDFLLASNQLTERVKKFNRQMLIEDDMPLFRNVLPEEEVVSPNFANVTIGYHLDETSSRVVRLFVTSPESSTKNRWEYCFYDENELEGEVVPFTPQQGPTQPPQPNADLKDALKPKKDKDSNDEDES